MDGLTQLKNLRESAEKALREANTPELLEEWRIRYLGRKGNLTTVLRGLADLPQEERARVGALANELKRDLENAFGAATVKPSSEAKSELDVTLAGRAPRKGGLHISTQILRQMTTIFNDLGFQTVEGPEVEWESYNFDKLNFPPDHPSRDLMDTIWVDMPGGRLLRTHTSNMQIRTMENTPPPVRAVSPGKCYRNEATDTSHEWHFHQMEGFAVGEDITFAQMKWSLEYFVKRMFGDKRQMRMRCDYFPFVEPGVDVSIDCFKCDGGGCRTCGHTGWIEILGAGMVHPNVLKAVGYDPERVSGFAFGMGPERIAMIKYGIEDIRLFFENDLRFLTQF